MVSLLAHKILLCVGNGFFVVIGILMIAIGIWSLTGPINQFQNLLEHTTGLAIGMIIVGLLTLAVALLGFCGVLMESWLLLIIFAAGLCVLMVSHVIIVAVTRACWNDTDRSTQRKMYEWLDRCKLESVNKTYSDCEDTYQSFWDDLQSTFYCCGVKGPSDWTERKMDIPESCCPPVYYNHKKEVTHRECQLSGSFFDHGCTENFQYVTKGIFILIVSVLVCTIIGIASQIAVGIWMIFKVKELS